MDRATVIVALPPVGDKVYKISSEKVPHLTMLYLGNVDLSEEAILYVQHACAELSPFGLSVEYRGKLGEDDADVLFFEKNAWDISRVLDFRHYLLLNNEIKRAYDSTEQFPEWTPHLTLGYPEAPAVDDDEERRVSYVDFDRVAVWTGDFEGPEFRLKYDNHAMEVAMSDMTTAERGAAAVKELFHFGVKGMKWGVRNDKGHEGEAVKTKKLGKLDKQWEKENAGVRGYIKVHNAVADRMNNGEIDRFNNEPRWKKAADDGVLTNDNHPETKAYFEAYEKLSNRMMAEEAVNLGMNPSGTKGWQWTDDGDGNPYAMLAPTKKDVQHAEGDIQQVLKVKRASNGLIESIALTEVELKHYGVKGMKWGVRRDDPATSGPAPVTVTQKKPGTFAKVAGGQRHPIHDDAVTALEARQKARASTTDALSNTELRKAVERMNLEKQYNQLQFESDRRGKGARFVAGLFGMKRYTGEKRRFVDDYEETGGKVRDAMRDVLEEKAKAAA